MIHWVSVTNLHRGIREAARQQDLAALASLEQWNRFV